MSRYRHELLRLLSTLTVLAGLSASALQPVQAQTAPSAGTTGNQGIASLLQQASTAGSFTTLARAVEAAGVADGLQSGASYTILAPTDAAFASLPAGIIDRLLQPENRALLRQVLSYHVIPQEVTSSDFSTGTTKVLGGGISVLVTPDRIIVNDGSVVQPNIQAQNGVIHAINRVLMPRELRAQLASLQ